MSRREVPSFESGRVENSERMFIVHWLFDGRLRILHAGSTARTILGHDTWPGQDGVVDDVFQNVLTSNLKAAFDTGNYRSGQHKLIAAGAGEGIELAFEAADSGSEGVFWSGHVLDDKDTSTQEEPGISLAERIIEWLNLAENPWDMIWFKDVAGRYLYANAAFEVFSRLKPGTALGKKAAEIFGEQRAAYIQIEHERVLKAGKSIQTIETTFDRESGEVRTTEIVRQPIRDESGGICGIFCMGRDLKAGDRRERELLKEISRYRNMLDLQEHEIAYFTQGGDLLFVNTNVQHSYGAKPSRFKLVNLFRTPEFNEDGGTFRQSFVAAVESRQEVEAEVTRTAEDGTTFSRRLRFIPDLDLEGDIRGVMVMGSSPLQGQNRKTQDRDAQASTDWLSLQLNSVLAATQDAVWVRDADGRFVVVNRAFEALTGVSSMEITGRRLLKGATELPPEISGPHNASELESNRPALVQETVRHAGDGTLRDLEIHIHPITNFDGSTRGIVGIARDVTEQKLHKLELEATKRQIRELAHSDALTGLPNERHARERIATTLQAADGAALSDAVLLININRFSDVNDSIGYSAGDTLLANLAQRVKHAAGRFYVARFSGNEFIVHAHQTDREGAENLAEKILDIMSVPFLNDRRYFSMSSNIGICMLPGTARNADEVVTQAGLALREAKKRKLNGFYVFEQNLVQAAKERFSLETDFRMGLEKGEFETYYQPKFDLVSNRMTGAEALMRWKHPRRGNIPPAMFIPLAEETGLIVPLGEKILYDACVFAREWNERSDSEVKIAVNLSPLQLMASNFNLVLRDILERAGCRAEWLELEITENLILSEQMKVGALLEELSEMGISIAIDDFGTGYSAMSYLISYPISTLKIDRSFVRDVISDSKKAVLVRAIIDMAHGLQMNTVAEGIETADEAKWVRDAGCVEGQGFLWCRAISKPAFLQMAGIFFEEDNAAE